MNNKALTAISSHPTFQTIITDLACIEDVREIKQIRDQAEVLRVYARNIAAGLEAQNRCAEVKIRAERRAGEILNPDKEKRGRPKKLHDETFLRDLGISKIQSHRWQSIAKIPKGDFEGYIKEVKQKGEELTSTGIYYFAGDFRREDDFFPFNGSSKRKTLEESKLRIGLTLNKIYRGDCVKLMKKINDKTIDLTITSPPYDELREYQGYDLNFEALAQELYRVTKPGGVVVWVVGDSTINGSESQTSFKQAIYFKEEAGFNQHDTMIYEKCNVIPQNGSRYEQVFEYMFVFSKGNPKTFNPIMEAKKYEEKRKIKIVHRRKDGKFTLGRSKNTPYKRVGNIWTYKVGGGQATKDRIARKHPAIFPEQLALDHILSWSNKGDIILDPLCGSGTTCKMAKINERYYIGIDICREYVEIARKRVSRY